MRFSMAKKPLSHLCCYKKDHKNNSCDNSTFLKYIMSGEWIVITLIIIIIIMNIIGSFIRDWKKYSRKFTEVKWQRWENGYIKIWYNESEKI